MGVVRVKRALIRHASMHAMPTDNMRMPTCMHNISSNKVYKPTCHISMQYAGTSAVYVNANMQCADMQYVSMHAVCQCKHTMCRHAVCQCKHAICWHAICQHGVCNANMQYASIAVCHAMTKHAFVPTCNMPACKMSMYSPNNMYSHRWRNINLSGEATPNPPIHDNLIKKNCIQTSSNLT